jgi:threonine dehydrogenase-like Zn-dependent dehydrogenase
MKLPDLLKNLLNIQEKKTSPKAASTKNSEKKTSPTKKVSKILGKNPLLTEGDKKEMMLSLKIADIGKIGLMMTPYPAIGDFEVLLKVLYVGFCGSDLNTFMGNNALAIPEVIPGHEVAAEVVKKGKHVPSTIKLGMLCTVMPYSSCGQCTACLNEKKHACKHNKTLGVQKNGAMSEYISVNCSKIITDSEKRLSIKQYALVEPLSVGFHAADRVAISDSDTVLVLGCGMIGLGAVIRAAIRGAKVIACDLDEEKVKLAKTLGANSGIHYVDEDDFNKKLSQMTFKNGADVVIEAVGTEQTYQTALNAVAFTGRIACIGYSKNDIPLKTQLFVKKELDILGSRNATRKDFDAVIRYMKKGKFPLDKLISGIYRPQDAQNAMLKWAENPGKVFRIMIAFNDSDLKISDK